MKIASLIDRRFWKLDASAVGACVFLSVIVYVVGLGPIWRSHTSRASRQAELVARQERANQLEMVTRITAGRLAEAKKSLDAHPLRLEPPTMLNRRLAAVSELAGREGLTIQEIRPGALNPAGLIGLELSGRGGYRACATFLSVMKQQYADLAVKRLELKADQGESGSFRLELAWQTAPAGQVQIAGK